MSLTAHSGGRSGGFNSQLTVLYCNFFGDLHMLCFNHGARIFNVPRIHVSVARGLHLEHEFELLVGVTLLSLLLLSSCLTWNLSL